MRTITISTDVFAQIWSLRSASEETEDEILRRILAQTTQSSVEQSQMTAARQIRSDITWREDVREALESLGGRSSLSRLYGVVRELRKSQGRSLPRSFEAVVRRTLEESSSDSGVYLGRHDLFWMPEGKGAGVWALR